MNRNSANTLVTLYTIPHCFNDFFVKKLNPRFFVKLNPRLFSKFKSEYFFC
jgi:hypothetical protein